MNPGSQRLGEFEIRECLKRGVIGLFAHTLVVGALVIGAAVVAPSISQAEENPPAAPGSGNTPTVATPKPAAGVEIWFAQVDEPQQEAFQKQVVQPFEAGAADLRARYLTGLDAAIARASAAGQLEEALACRAERQAFDKAHTVADDDGTTPGAVKTLRVAFRQQLAKLEQDRAAKARALFAEYDAILAKNQNLLTQRARLDEAQFIKTKRDEIAHAWLGMAPSTAVVAAPHPESAKPMAMSIPVATKDIPFVNTLGMKFVPVPRTQVLFSVWDTRVQDYAAYADAKKVDTSWKKQDKDGVPVGRELNHPVVGVSWEDAQGFCQWLTEKETAEGKLPKGLKYRLPTDEEWSWAAGMPPELGATPAEKRQKNSADFPWGKDFPPTRKVGNYADETFHGKFSKGATDKKKDQPWIVGYDDGYATTSPVESFPANAYGLYDMGGNVRQWCEDWFDASHKDRVMRGASWANYDRGDLLSSARLHGVLGSRRSNYGFRCVVGVSAPSPGGIDNIALATSTPSIAPGTSATTAELVKTYRNSLVFVTGANGSGSGFLANFGTGSVLFTNAHVAAGVKGAVFKTLDGTEVKTSAASCAVGHDVFLLQATAIGPPLEIMKGVDQNTAIGDEVVVLGNAEGAGVINTITGKIVGLGPQLVEVDAPFQPGNSGSPIIHLKSGKVVGVATYAIIRKYDPSTKEPVKVPVIRRFGYRLDSIKSWQPVNWPAFSAQAAEMEAVEKLTKDLAAFLDDLAKNSHVTRGAHNNPVIKNRIDSWLEDRAKRPSPRDAAMVNKSFLSFLKITCQTDVVVARQHMTYDYFQRDLADEQRERDEIAGAFDEIIQNIRQ